MPTRNLRFPIISFVFVFLIVTLLIQNTAPVRARASRADTTGAIIDPRDSTAAKGEAERFNFKQYLLGANSTLTAYVQSLNKVTGEVMINGAEIRQISTPFTFEWGDETSVTGYFPQNHKYSDSTKNYYVKVRSRYPDGISGEADAIARFVPPSIQAKPLPPDISVRVPNQNVTLQSRLPGFVAPTGLTYFDDSYFDLIQRSTAEYAMMVAATIQKDFLNDDVILFDGKYDQVILRAPEAGGMFSIWFTNPIGVGAGNYAFSSSIEWSSLFHEMGHNGTLNTPSRYIYGGKIDGSANAIFSETMAQIFQHATVYEIANNYERYGLSEDLAYEIELSGIASIKLVKRYYDRYLSSGKHFTSWNPPGSSGDETLDTFMTIAYKFCENAENEGLGYRGPLKRMLKLLQLFDQDMQKRYDQRNNTQAAATFRSTLMVAALSFAFSKDLRAEFRNLNFPIDDQTYNALYQRAAATIPSPAVVSAASFAGSSIASESIVAVFGANFAATTLAATSSPLPTSLAGASAIVKDSAGTQRVVSLFFVSPDQINCLIPSNLANGRATIAVTRGDGFISFGTIQIAAVAPGLFSANSNGQGVASALALRVKDDGSQIYEPIAQFDAAQNKFVSRPIDLGPQSDQVFLVLFGTGMRFRSALTAASASIGGVGAPVLYVGQQGEFIGLDQVNIPIPRSLIGRGEVDVALTIDTQQANTVKVNIK